MSRTIPELMEDDHAKIKGFLEEFKDNPNKKTFERFEWELEKHVFVEEKAIFTFPIYDPDTDFDYSVFRELINQHEELLERMDTLKQEMESGTNIEINDFIELFDEHLSLEQRDVYPKLDRALTNKQKRKIVYKITNAF